MATELGQAYVQIIPSAKGISGAIQQQLDPEAESAGQSAGLKIGTGLKVALVAATAATAALVGKVIKDSIGEGAQLQQSLGGVETLFKDSADKVKQYANEAYKTAGLSANDYMENVTSFSASLLQSMGGNTETAAEKANMAMIDMSDNANKMGTNMQDIQNAYSGFAKQNYTMLDNLKLGYGGTKSEMERLLADATKLTGVKYDINNLADVYDAIHAVQEKLDITGTTALESTKTFSGSLTSMKSALSNVLGGLALGQDIKPALNALAETTSTFLFGNFIPMVTNILTALPGAIATFFQAAAPSFLENGMQLLNQLSAGVLSGIPNFLVTFQTLLVSIMGWITQNLPTFLNIGVEILTNIVNGILQYLPQLITVASQLLNTFVVFLLTNMPVILETGKNLILNLIDGIISNLPAIGASAIQAVSTFIDTIIANYPQYIQSGWNILQSLVQGILDRLPALITAAVTLIGQFVNMIISKIPDVVSSGIQVLLGLVTGILNSIPNLVGAMSNIANTIKTSVSNINLFGAGKAIIDGFLNGLKASFGAVKDFVGGIASWIAENKGPIEYDRKLLVPAGNAIMQGLDESLQDKFKSVQATVGGMADKLKTGISFDVAGEFNRSEIDMSIVSDANRIIAYKEDSAENDSRINDLYNLINTINERPIYVQSVVDGKSFNKENAPYQSAIAAKRNNWSGRGLALDARF